jgi:hypothetical protein
MSDSLLGRMSQADDAARLTSNNVSLTAQRNRSEKGCRQLISQSKKALNFISALQSSLGSGVRPASYSGRNLATQVFLFGRKLTVSISTSTAPATLTASIQSLRVEYNRRHRREILMKGME